MKHHHSGIQSQISVSDAGRQISIKVVQNDGRGVERGLYLEPTGEPLEEGEQRMCGYQMKASGSRV